MHFHLTDVQLLVGGFALVMTVFLVVAAVIDFRGKKPQPFRNHFYSVFNQDDSQDGSSAEPDEWHAYNRARAQAYETRNRATQERDSE